MAYAAFVFMLAAALTAAPLSQPPRRDVFLFLGDSLTAGYGVPMDSAYPALLGERWARAGLPYRVRNAGVSGATTAGILETLEWSLSPEVHTVFLCVGANDGLRGLKLEQTRRNLDDIVAQAKSKGIRVVMARMKLPPNYGADYTGRFERLYGEIARRHGVKLMPFLLEGVAGRPAMNIEDGIHPNEAGHRLIAGNVHDFLVKERLLK